MQIWAESGKSALPICNYSQILYQFLTFTQNLKRSQKHLILYFDSSRDSFTYGDPKLLRLCIIRFITFNLSMFLFAISLL